MSGRYTIPAFGITISESDDNSNFCSMTDPSIFLYSQAQMDGFFLNRDKNSTMLMMSNSITNSMAFIRNQPENDPIRFVSTSSDNGSYLRLMVSSEHSNLESTFQKGSSFRSSHIRGRILEVRAIHIGFDSALVWYRTNEGFSCFRLGNLSAACCSPHKFSSSSAELSIIEILSHIYLENHSTGRSASISTFTASNALSLSLNSQINSQICMSTVDRRLMIVDALEGHVVCNRSFFKQRIQVSRSFKKPVSVQKNSSSATMSIISSNSLLNPNSDTTMEVIRGNLSPVCVEWDGPTPSEVLVGGEDLWLADLRTVAGGLRTLASGSVLFPRRHHATGTYPTSGKENIYIDEIGIGQSGQKNLTYEKLDGAFMHAVRRSTFRPWLVAAAMSSLEEGIVLVFDVRMGAVVEAKSDLDGSQWANWEETLENMAERRRGAVSSRKVFKENVDNGVEETSMVVEGEATNSRRELTTKSRDLWLQFLEEERFVSANRRKVDGFADADTCEPHNGLEPVASIFVGGAARWGGSQLKSLEWVGEESLHGRERFYSAHEKHANHAPKSLLVGFASKAESALILDLRGGSPQETPYDRDATYDIQAWRHETSDQQELAIIDTNSEFDETDLEELETQVHVTEQKLQNILATAISGDDSSLHKHSNSDENSQNASVVDEKIEFVDEDPFYDILFNEQDAFVAPKSLKHRVATTGSATGERHRTLVAADIPLRTIDTGSVASRFAGSVGVLALPVFSLLKNRPSRYHKMITEFDPRFSFVFISACSSGRLLANGFFAAPLNHANTLNSVSSFDRISSNSPLANILSRLHAKFATPSQAPSYFAPANFLSVSSLQSSPESTKNYAEQQLAIRVAPGWISSLLSQMPEFQVLANGALPSCPHPIMRLLRQHPLPSIPKQVHVASPTKSTPREIEAFHSVRGAKDWVLQGGRWVGIHLPSVLEHVSRLALASVRSQSSNWIGDLPSLSKKVKDHHLKVLNGLKKSTMLWDIGLPDDVDDAFRDGGDDHDAISVRKFAVKETKHVLRAIRSMYEDGIPPCTTPEFINPRSLNLVCGCSHVRAMLSLLKDKTPITSKSLEQGGAAVVSFADILQSARCPPSRLPRSHIAFMSRLLDMQADPILDPKTGDSIANEFKKIIKNSREAACSCPYAIVFALDVLRGTRGSPNGCIGSLPWYPYVAHPFALDTAVSVSSLSTIAGETSCTVDWTDGSLPSRVCQCQSLRTAEGDSANWANAVDVRLESTVGGVSDIRSKTKFNKEESYTVYSPYQIEEASQRAPIVIDSQDTENDILQETNSHALSSQLYQNFRRDRLRRVAASAEVASMIDVASFVKPVVESYSSSCCMKAVSCVPTINSDVPLLPMHATCSLSLTCPLTHLHCFYRPPFTPPAETPAIPRPHDPYNGQSVLDAANKTANSKAVSFAEAEFGESSLFRAPFSKSNEMRLPLVRRRAKKNNKIFDAQNDSGYSAHQNIQLAKLTDPTQQLLVLANAPITLDLCGRPQAMLLDLNAHGAPEFEEAASANTVKERLNSGPYQHVIQDIDRTNESYEIIAQVGKSSNAIANLTANSLNEELEQRRSALANEQKSFIAREKSILKSLTGRELSSLEKNSKVLSSTGKDSNEIIKNQNSFIENGVVLNDFGITLLESQWELPASLASAMASTESSRTTYDPRVDARTRHTSRAGVPSSLVFKEKTRKILAEAASSKQSLTNSNVNFEWDILKWHYPSAEMESVDQTRERIAKSFTTGLVTPRIVGWGAIDDEDKAQKRRLTRIHESARYANSSVRGGPSQQSQSQH